MGKLVADIIVETLQNAGVKHCYGVVGDTLNLIARSLENSDQPADNSASSRRAASGGAVGPATA
jgi:thiamine pyrophosphate-dependent acetolactate synthase large subunit-like protein